LATSSFRSCAIEDDEGLSDDFAANGTPHFFVNGKRLAGAQPLEAFTTLIDAELAKAKALVAGGVKPDAVYDATIKDGLTPPAPEKKTVPPMAKGPARGAARAKVTIDEFSDFQCPFCKKGEEVVDAVVKRYGTKVRIAWHNFPLPMHPDAPLAAEAAMEAYAQNGDAGFWKMHDLLFANQKVEGGLQREALDGYAKTIGLDMTKWMAAMDARNHKDAVEADAAVGRTLGVDGTPTFFVNGYEIDGAQPLVKFKRLIERALTEAK
jgi:protein-disulfide isomerase